MNGPYDEEGEDEKWYFVDNPYDATTKLLWVDNIYDADLKVMFVDSPYDAEWRTGNQWQNRLWKPLKKTSAFDG